MDDSVAWQRYRLPIRVKQDSLLVGLFAGARDAPAIEVIVLQNYQASSATDAYGIAEPSIIPTAPAIANAVYNATGIRLRTTPMTPAVVLSGLGHRPKAEASS